MSKRIVALFLLALPALCAGPLRVGTAAVVITPPPGAPMAGYYHNRGAEGTHDDLYAKALVMELEGVRAALVSCDLIGIPEEIVAKARSLIATQTGIPASHVMISATHSHTGPVILAGQSRYNLQGEMLRIGQEYADGLPAKIAASVRDAAAAMQPATVSEALGAETSLAFNRRYRMKDGSVGWNPGKKNPNIIRPAGPVDPGLPVLYFRALDAKPLAVYVNFALHLDTVGGMRYSADFPYTLSRSLASAKDPELLTVFTMGCSGNVNHIDVSSAEPQKGHAEAARIGAVLAGEVLKTLAKATPVEPGSLKAASEIADLPLPEIGPADLEWARGVAPKFGQQNAAPFLDLVRAFKTIDVAERKGTPLSAEVQVIALGKEIAWVGLPGEIFTELGLMIKQASPFKQTIVTSLANGSIGYVPNRKAYNEGAYEVISARCGPGSGEILVDTATKLLVALHAKAR